MKVIFDTNVVLDVLAAREPFADVSTEAMALVSRKRFAAAITANTVTDLYFLLRKHVMDRNSAKVALERMVRAITVLDTNRELCLLAFRSPVDDFEDAILVESAKQWFADCIVTRSVSDFVASAIEAITPDEFLHRFAN